MTKSIILIRPPDPLQSSALLSHTKPMNLAYLAGYLRRAGFDLKILDYESRPFSIDNLKSCISERNPFAVGITSSTSTISSAASIASAVKKINSSISTIIGGSHASSLPFETLQEFDTFDYLVFGEGEETLLQLCRLIIDGGDPSKIDGLGFRSGSEIIINQQRKLIEDIDTIPFPARDLIEYSEQAGHSSRGFSNRTLSTELFTSRGCPVGCSFCAIQSTFGRSVRFRSPAYIAEELHAIEKLHNFNHLVIADDTFTLIPDRAAEICEHIAKSSIISWNCDTRVNAVSLELLKLMKNSGCEKVAFGVESGSSRILDLIGKKISIEQVVNAVQLAKKAGIKHIEGNFIIGCDPSETAEELEETKRLITSLPWTFVSVAIIVPYPGTPVRMKMIEQKLIDEDASWDDYVMFGRAPRWRTENFSSVDLLNLQKELTRTFYLRPRYIFSRLASIRSKDEIDYWLKAGLSYLKWYATGKA